MILPDHEIMRRATTLADLVIDPFRPEAVQPASYDVRLGSTLLRWWGDTVNPDLDQSAMWKPIPLNNDGGWLLYPGAFYLGVTLETLMIPNDLLCHLHGRSSLGRLGVQIHMAGLVDPGYMGRLTLELTVVAGPTRLKPGQPIGQVTFQQMLGAATTPYDGRYQDDTEPTPSRLFQEARQ